MVSQKPQKDQLYLYLEMQQDYKFTDTHIHDDIYNRGILAKIAGLQLHPI